MNKETVSILKELFQKIKIPTIFGPDDYDDYGRVESAITDALSEIGIEWNDVYITCGCTKAVIIFEEYDCVVKIPFNGTWIRTYNGLYDEEDTFEFLNYDNASSTTEPWNYCASELDIYNKVKDAGFGDFIAPLDFLCFSQNDYPIYIQEKAKIFNSVACNSATKDSEQEVDTLSREHMIPMSRLWVALAIDYYGKELVNNFLEYLEDTEILEDLHAGNIGFTEADDKPIIIDYGGFDS